MRVIARAAADAGAKWVYLGVAFGVTMGAELREHFFMNLSAVIRRFYVEVFGSDYFCPTPRGYDLRRPLLEVARERSLMVRMGEIALFMRQRFKARTGKQTSMFED